MVEYVPISRAVFNINQVQSIRMKLRIFYKFLDFRTLYYICLQENFTCTHLIG